MEKYCIFLGNGNCSIRQFMKNIIVLITKLKKGIFTCRSADYLNFERNLIMHNTTSPLLQLELTQTAKQEQESNF